MAISEFRAAINQVATERGISAHDVLDSVRVALYKAYVKDFGGTSEDIKVELDEETGESRIFDLNGKDITPSGFGRIAASTAKQVIIQKIRETEKAAIIEEMKVKIKKVVSGIVFKVENGLVVVDLGKTQGIMPRGEQVSSETYIPGQRLKVYVKEIRDGSRGTEVIVSRSDAEFVAQLFEEEVPEIANGTVEIVGIAREAGSRTKMAVYSSDDKIDPVGSCVGQKGVRVQAIIQELFGEKIDIIPFATSIEKFIAASLSPARVTEVEINEAEKTAAVSVPEDQLSLAIGKEGQNVRLAFKLTKWKIDIKGMKGVFDNITKEDRPAKESAQSVRGIWDEEIETLRESKEAEAKAKQEESEKMKSEIEDSNSEEIKDQE
ncbi:MAG: transcription termination/antitermination protein NusA [Proteobacteria bacterium]|nr:transcription termination/antitermination protein NusA [Pseudomonadota bacterium]